jgi:hypothetical protein
VIVLLCVSHKQIDTVNIWVLPRRSTYCSHHEDCRGSRGVAPLIFNLSTGLISQLHALIGLLSKKRLWCIFRGRRLSQSGCSGERNVPLSLSEFEPRIVQAVVYSLHELRYLDSGVVILTDVASSAVEK